MQFRSAEFDVQVSGNHRVSVEAELFLRGESVGTIPVLGGDWTDDRKANVRRSCRLSLPPTAELIPAAEWSGDGGLWPIGNEIQLRSGLVLPDGTPELLPVGRYRISKPVVNDSGSSITLSVEGYDRGRAVSRARFSSPYSIPSGTDYATAIRDLLLSRVPSLAPSDFRFMATDGSDGGPVFTTPGLLFTSQDDPWVKAMEMAQSFGAELFFDGSGDPVLRLERDPSINEPDWDYSEGEGTNLLGVDRSLDDEASYNGVVVTGSNSELPAPLHAEHWDTDPSSPTYYDPALPEASFYGPVPFFMDSQYIMTQAQADLAAQNNFLRVSGITETVNFNAIVHPAHESGDIVRVKRDRVNVDNVYVMDSVKCGLGHSGIMNATTRSRRVS